MNKIPQNKVTWFQLPADNVDRAYTFYSDVFDWNKNDAVINETNFGAINGSIESRTKTFQYPRIVIRVENVSHKMEQIKKAGGKIIEGRTEIPEINMVYAAFEDTEGNIVNIVGDLK
jgi:predicted enzyme related to lactoylglutathione lyase